ncbi:MAG: type II secretion system F family protein, partial [Candidatus Methylacidiphilales bacterium]
PSILIRQHAFLVMMQEIRSKTIGALVYPAVITVCGLALLFIVSFLLGPQLESMLSTMGKAQPLPTRLLLTGSRFLTTWWWAILLVASLSIMAFLRAIRTGSGRDLWHRWQLHIPVFGPVLAAQFHATLCHTLATLISSGIPLMNALRLVTHATANQHIRASLERASLMVAEGVSLSKALEKNGSFPSVLLDYISLGEQTGDLASALAKAGARYDNELSRNVAFLTSLIQPVIIICMALMVGLVAYAIISGIFSAVSGLKLRG